MPHRNQTQPRTPAIRKSVLVTVYALYFLSGAAALVFQILWTRQFVTVFGNSTYAISVVLAAYMGGLGLGAAVFGKIADRRRDLLALFALIEAALIVAALLIPPLLTFLSRAMPLLLSSVSNLFILSLVRFAFSFAILLIPCTLMGGTLPVLTRFVVESAPTVRTRLSLLYGLNTLGAAFGCLAAGFYLIETLGQTGTNHVALLATLAVIIVALLLRSATASRTAPSPSPAAEPVLPDDPTDKSAASTALAPLLLLAAFVSGLATMSVEVLWVRFLVFAVPNSQYSFTGILAVLLVGLAVGSLLYNLLLARRPRQLLYLAGIEIALGPVIIATLVLASRVAMETVAEGFAPVSVSAAGLLRAKSGAVTLAFVTVFLPTVLIGAVFPLVASAYAKTLSSVGRSVGRIYAVSTLGSIVGSLAPILFLVNLFGIQNGILAVAVLNSSLGLLVLLVAAAPAKRLRAAAVAASVIVALLAASRLVPPQLTHDVFFASRKHPGRHHTVSFYKEGPTATVMVIKDTITGLQEVHIGGVEEVPTTFTGHIFFKLFGTLGPVLHPEPSEVLVLCLGGGVTAGTITQHPSVDSVECVDLVRDMVGACDVLSDVNNNLVDSPKFTAVIEDARNYLIMRREKFPVILCDSTHPKSPDSWPLYTTEFYRSVKDTLADDGVFLQWVPFHSMSVTEFQMVVNTFQSVFPHASLWYIAGYDETGTDWATTVIVATPDRLSIDLSLLEDRLSADSVQADLAPWNLHTPVGFLSSFLCGEDTLREWTAGLPVNTDNLPFTQYFTSYTGATQYDWPSIAAMLESVYPYLSDSSSASAARLEAPLARSLKSRRLLLTRGLLPALQFAPDDPFLLTLRENLRLSKSYLTDLADLYNDDPRMLLQVAHRTRAVYSRTDDDMSSSFEPIARLYRQALAVDPDNVPALADYAALLAASGRTSDAVEKLNRALQLDSKDMKSRMTLGTLLCDSGRYDEGIKHLEIAASAAPDRVDVQNALAMALTAVGRTDEAVRLLTSAISLSGGSMADLHHNLACALAQKGSIDAALPQFEKAVSLEPHSHRFQLSLGLALLDASRAPQARQQFLSILADDPTDPDALTQLAIMSAIDARLDDAIARFRAALASRPSHAEAREHLALALVKKRDFAAAIDLLRDGMALQPTMEIARHLAWLLATCPDDSLRNGPEALAVAESLNRATSFSAPEALDVLAAAYAEVAYFPQASQTAQQAIDLALLQQKNSLADDIKSRLKLYNSSRPYRQQ